MNFIKKFAKEISVFGLVLLIFLGLFIYRQATFKDYKTVSESRLTQMIEDKEDFGIKLDKWQRKNLSKEELDSIYIATTNLIDILNKIKTNNITPKEIENVLKELKNGEKSEKELSEDEEFDIFGGLVDSNRKIRKIGNKRHRELKKDKYNILEINQKTNTLGFKLNLEKILENIKTALEKDVIDEEIPAYKAMCDEKIKRNT